ncbi:DEAD/DEAH box helicase family protein [Shewanella sp. HL-SH5]|uniref:DEAD/DEAH box helicase family protein n=1 Tax=Shewanella sp. HL-SH5 TaxID=3436241 RepID=UPI003EB8F32E
MAITGNDIDNIAAGFQYQLKDVVDVGRLYVYTGGGSQYSALDKPAVLVDHTLYDLSPTSFHYVSYTSYQNKLMHRYQGLYRFCASDKLQLLNDWQDFLLDEIEDIELRKFGANRSEDHIDPTPPEYKFAELFEQVYGAASIHALQAEAPYIDRLGHKRYVDYILQRTTNPIAIELNGETYHHPLSALVTENKYRSQLFKQNSLVKDGYLVYRWSDRGMSDEFKFEDQIKDYFGDANSFKKSPLYRAQRAYNFEIYQHQQDAVDNLIFKRENGQNSFLVVLPTGTGKTEVFIEDFRLQFQQSKAKQVLAIVPTRDLRQQLIERIQKRLPNINVGLELSNTQLDIVVQTSAYVLRHYRKLAKDYFDYIVVDEAHRAGADGLRQVLSYFSPETLLGLTATDQRYDQRQLADIFGQYEVEMTLEEAIQQKLVPQIRAFRLESNIDFSKVRFNGKEFVKSDLQKTVILPSRDQLIVDMLKKYFFTHHSEYKISAQQGVIFCVDIKHTQRMAALLNQSGITAVAVSGKDRSGLALYQQEKVQIICACELLNEGWDAPQTSILVMARPTMSKVLYTQQLGRGTRNHPGKEALYVIDVVDSYGAVIKPWSIHGLFNLGFYQPFGDVVKDVHGTLQHDLIILDGLWESERRIEPINIFNFEKEFSDLLNEEQLARELFISTGTVKAWMRKGELIASKTIPFGSKTLNYFSQQKLDDLRQDKNIPIRTQDTRKADFIEFIEKRDYTYSYKIIFMLIMINHHNPQGEVDIDKMVQHYSGFYQTMLDQYGRSEKEHNPLNRHENLFDNAYIKRSIGSNPFEKFERKRFFYQCNELSLMSFDTVLWEKLEESDLKQINKQMLADLKDYYAKLDIILKPSDLNSLHLSTSALSMLNDAPQDNVIYLPFYEDLKIACGHFKTSSAEQVRTIKVPAHYGNLNSQKHFIARAKGDSMNGGKQPICDGDYLLFEWITSTSAGSISNHTLAIELLDETGDPQYLLRKVKKLGQGQYTLSANNPDYQDMLSTTSMNTFARFKGVIEV